MDCGQKSLYYILASLQMATAVSRPVSLPPDVPRLPRRSTYDPPQAEVCQRCQQKVYPMEKVGNISGVTFHKLCFRCYVCNQMLTLRTYYTNHTHPTDKEASTLTFD